MTQLDGHMDYELGMLRWAAESLTGIGPEKPHPTNGQILWRNLYEECFLLHAYNLYMALPEHPPTEWSEKVPVAARDHLLTLTMARLSPRVVNVSADYQAILADIETLVAR